LKSQASISATTASLLKFMVVIHTAYATMKMSDPKGIITIKVDQLGALACENTSLSQASRFGDKVAQEQAAKVSFPSVRKWNQSLNTCVQDV
jgi:hypothetical protein